MLSLQIKWEAGQIEEMGNMEKDEENNDEMKHLPCIIHVKEYEDPEKVIEQQIHSKKLTFSQQNQLSVATNSVDNSLGASTQRNNNNKEATRNREEIERATTPNSNYRTATPDVTQMKRSKSQKMLRKEASFQRR